VGLLEEAGKTLPKLASIARWLRDIRTIEAIRQKLNEKKVKGSEDVTIIIDDEFPLEQDGWHDWWRKFRRPLVKKIDRSRLCLITGEMTKPMATHYKIEKLGGRATGDALIGFDKEAFRSYGLEQSENAAVSEEAMCAYRAGLNELIASHSQRFAGATIVHWFKEKVKDVEDPFFWLQQVLGTPEQEELDAQHRARELLESVRTGKRADLAKNIYYVMTLSGADGRVMVRDWIEGQFEELVINISLWFDDLEIVRLSDTRNAGNPRLESVVTSLLPPRRRSQNYEDWVRPVGSARVELLRSAIKGLSIRTSIISRLVTVHRAFILSEEWHKLIGGERDTSIKLAYSTLYARMGLIKAYHLRKDRKEGNTLTEVLKPVLNENYPNPAYHCGRLMAVLAELQRAAIGDIGASVIQRYYASASATPALVLGRLTRTSQFHLGGLETGLARWYEGKIIDIWSRIKSCVPRTLSLEEQSLFALGYYQQLADMRIKKSEKTEKEESNG